MHAKESNKNRRILIVDDNPSIHADFAKILCPAGNAHASLLAEAADLFGHSLSTTTTEKFELDSAYQGAEALRMAEAAQAEGRPYAVAFVDVRMPPGWDGVETISRIWRSCPDIQMVICTAYSDHSWEEIIAQVGKTESLLILKKPFDNVEVLQLAHALTEKWALNHELNGRLSDLQTLVAERTRELQDANTSLRSEAVERELAQAELQRSEERFSKAFHANPVPIVIQNVAENRFIDANESFLSMSGYAREDLMSLPVETLHLTYAQAQPMSPNSVRCLPASIRARSGEVRDVVVSTESIVVGGQVCLLSLFLDVTEQRLLERKLRQAQKLEALGQLAAGIAHNFNNILGVILGHASLQMQFPNSGDSRRSLEEIASAAERGAGLVRQLLAAGQQQRKEEKSLDLNAAVTRTKELLAPLLGHQVELACTTAETLCPIMGDASSIDQILMNLVLNARDAMPDGGRILIQTARAEIDEQHVAANPQARAGTWARLSVIDNGTGMAPATMERVFEPFFTTKGVGVGTGLGLATVHGIVAQHGGWIELTSELGAGSAFHVFLPASTALPTQVPDGAPQQAAAEEGETVLLVEDEPGLQRLLRVTLERNGYQVLVAGDVEKALSIWSSQGKEVDLVLTDVSMPGGRSGFDLAELLRSSRPDLPIIFSSGYAPHPQSDVHRYQGAKFLQKPYTPDFVLKAVRASLNAAA